MSKLIHVMVGVIWGEGDQILIAKRPDHLHQGGRWEFPGGKLEVGEDPALGLARELAEELGIEVEASTPWMQISHDYPEKSVLLDIWQVSAFNGTARGVEGQKIRWVPLAELGQYEFPEANKDIVARLQA